MKQIRFSSLLKICYYIHKYTKTDLGVEALLASARKI